MIGNFQKACLAVSPIWNQEQMFLHASSVSCYAWNHLVAFHTLLAHAIDDHGGLLSLTS
jgi:hypothetical protein